MFVQVSQERFLANECTKVRLILTFTNRFEETTITVKMIEEDSDVIIVNSTISLISTFNGVFDIGEDMDLLILLTAFSCASLGDPKLLKDFVLQRIFKQKDAIECIPVILGFSDCVTISSLFNHGKLKFSSL